MAIRNIVKIDEEKCNGCGECVHACAEGAIQLINGKAKLVSEIYCDGLGACLDCCPVDAITIEQREAEEFDEEATQKHLDQMKKPESNFVCPGMAMKSFDKKKTTTGDTTSQLQQWPVQLKLVSPAAPYFKSCDLLIAADCVAFAMGDFHEKLLKGKGVVIACPKLDDPSGYVDKLTEIIKSNELKSIAVAHMQVPCCSGIVRMAEQAIENSGSDLQLNNITISIEGEIL